MRTILFDLDGTLLPMNQNVFVNDYFRRMAKYCAPYGFEPEQLVKDIWKGTAAMVANDGTITNEERFWQVFHELTGRGSEADRNLFLSFYETEFDAVKEVCGFTAEAGNLIRDLKARGDDLILATNPLFPRTATLHRIAWAGLSPDDFRMITTYEMMNTCKPNPEYFRELCRKAEIVPEECVLIGNDAVEDVAAAETGMQVFLITDCLENGTEDALTVPHGSFADARTWLVL
jgi:FMN phosphatase YigB (HAD superfamily)